MYELPNLHVEGALVRTNLVPRTIVRGPGFLNAVMIVEQVRVCAAVSEPVTRICLHLMLLTLTLGFEQSAAGPWLWQHACLQYKLCAESVAC